MSETKQRRGRKSRIQQATAPEDNPPVWPGLESGRFKPLSPSEATLIEETAFQLLETLGLSQATPSMIEQVVAAGGQTTDDDRLLFPRDLVEWAIEDAQRGFTLCGQVPENDLRIEGARVHMSTGGAAPGVFDLDTHEYRDSTLQDLYDAARIVDRMENIHHFSRPVVARDIDGNAAMDLNTAFACLSGTSKHVSISITEPQNVPEIAELCYHIAGGEAEFRARPFLTVMVCHVGPPDALCRRSLRRSRSRHHCGLSGAAYQRRPSRSHKPGNDSGIPCSGCCRDTSRSGVCPFSRSECEGDLCTQTTGC